MVDAAAMIAAINAALVALLLHWAAEGPAHHRDVGGCRAGHFREEHAEHGDDLRQTAANMTDQRHRQIGDAHDHVGRAHQFADEKKERDRKQSLIVDAVENFLDDGGKRNVREQCADKHAASSANGTGTPR